VTKKKTPQLEPGVYGIMIAPSGRRFKVYSASESEILLRLGWERT
jgi:hypothetical protein